MLQLDSQWQWTAYNLRCFGLCTSEPNVRPVHNDNTNPSSWEPHWLRRHLHQNLIHAYDMLQTYQQPHVLMYATNWTHTHLHHNFTISADKCPQHVPALRDVLAQCTLVHTIQTFIFLQQWITAETTDSKTEHFPLRERERDLMNCLIHTNHWTSLGYGMSSESSPVLAFCVLQWNPGVGCLLVASLDCWDHLDCKDDLIKQIKAMRDRLERANGMVNMGIHISTLEATASALGDNIPAPYGRAT